MSVRNAVTRIPNHEQSVPFARISWSCAGFGLAVGFLELLRLWFQILLRSCDGWMHRAGVRSDPLTGLWNRGAIIDLLKREVSRRQRTRDALGVIMADIDYFKKIQ